MAFGFRAEPVEGDFIDVAQDPRLMSVVQAIRASTPRLLPNGEPPEDPTTIVPEPPVQAPAPSAPSPAPSAPVTPNSTNESALTPSTTNQPSATASQPAAAPPPQNGGLQTPGDPARPDLHNVYSLVPAYYSGVMSGEIDPRTLNYFLREKIRRGEMHDLYDITKKPGAAAAGGGGGGGGGTGTDTGGGAGRYR